MNGVHIVTDIVCNECASSQFCSVLGDLYFPGCIHLCSQQKDIKPKWETAN